MSWNPEPKYGSTLALIDSLHVKIGSRPGSVIKLSAIKMVQEKSSWQ